MSLNHLETTAAKQNNPTFVYLLGRALWCTNKNTQWGCRAVLWVVSFLLWSYKILLSKREENLFCFINTFSLRDDDDIVFLSLVHVVFFLVDRQQKNSNVKSLFFMQFFFFTCNLLLCFYMCLSMKHLMLNHFKLNWKIIECVNFSGCYHTK